MTTSMPNLPASASSDAAHRSARDKRKNHRLRDLVDEMLASVRVAANRDLWTVEERDQTEEQLAHIMKVVRAEAMQGRRSD